MLVHSGCGMEVEVNEAVKSRVAIKPRTAGDAKWR